MSDSPTPSPRFTPIAVVGASALFPGSADAGGFWRDILAGRDLMTEVPPSHWLPEDYYDPDPKVPDKTYAKRGAFLSEIDFDPLAFGVPPAIVPATDTSQLLALIVARQVLEDAAGGQFAALDKSRISIILGVTSAQEMVGNMVSRLQRPIWVKSLRESGLPEDKVQEACDRIAGHYVPWQESTFPGLLGNVVAGRIANRFDLGGANFVTDAACASALAALSMAVNELRLGDSDMVIAGGVETLNDIFMYMCFSKTPALSPTGDCRPFSDQADGTLLGEGLGMVALKRLADAERDGDRVYAVIRGIGASSDGRAKSVYAPVPEGQALAIERAYDLAGYPPATVELVEAHGTATRAGDAAEFAGLRLAFERSSGNGDRPERRQWCALGSVKSQIGHTKAAAGVAGLFKAVMALHHKVLPPTIKVERPNPALELESSPFYLNTRSQPWIKNGDHPRRAGVSSFGFGGSNFHVALEEYHGEGHRPPRLRTAKEELVLVTAGSVSALVERCAEIVGEVAEAPDGRTPDGRTPDGRTPELFTWLAADSQQRYSPDDPHRLAVVAGDAEDLCRKLGDAGQRIAADPETPFAAPGVYYGCGEHQGKVAFLFPGQGSQYPDMGAGLAMFFDRAREVWDRAATLALDGAKRLHEVVFEHPAWSEREREEQLEELTATRWTQPAIGAVSLSMLALLRVVGVQADCVAGHSYGELTALCAAGSFDEQTLLELSRQRGELMEAATSVAGTMTAVDISSEELFPRLEEWGHEVVIANRNAPRQVVLSGAVAEIEAVEEQLASESISFRRLPVAAAFHSPLVGAVAADFRAVLDDRDLAGPEIPVYSNAEATPYPAEPDGVRRLLAEQIARPVRFRALLEAMAESGVRTFIEVGPGSVLTGLVGRSLGDRLGNNGYLAVSLDRKGRDGVTSLWHGLGQLAAAGLPIDFARLWEPFGEIRDPRSLPQPKLTLKIGGANYGKLYPPPGGAAALPPPNPPQPAAGRLEFLPPASHPPELSLLQAPAPAPEAATPDRSEGSQWLHTYQDAQRQTVDAHLAFQRTMVEAQTAFLKTVEASFTGLSQPDFEQRPDLQPWDTPVVAELPQPELRPAFEALPEPATQRLPASEPAAQRPLSVQAGPETRDRQPRPAVAPPAAEPVAPATPAPAAAAPSGAELEGLMIEVVAEKTGYPAEMLNLEMDLESDLGVDSIKRVEILAAVRDREPELPEVDTTQLASLRTLGQIAEFLAVRRTGASVPVGRPPEVGPVGLGPVGPVGPVGQVGQVLESAPGAQIDPAALEGLMLEVVAEKTGYPAEMLNLEMDLESDLGVDSIKRVEILAAVRDREPELPEVDTTQLASLRTLGQIVEFLADRGPEGRPPEVGQVGLGQVGPVGQVGQVLESVPGAEIDPAALEGLMLEVVAEKTGYPAEMLNLEMDLESDLGVDSIKRVEILAAVRDREPELPEVDTTQLASLRTLGQIVEFLGARPAADAVAETAGGEAEVASEPEAVPALGRFALRTVLAPPIGLALPGLVTAARVAVTDDGGGVAAALVDELVARGVVAEVIPAGRTPEVPDTATAVLFLDGLAEVADLDQALEINRRAFRAARAAAPRLAEGGVFVTVQDTGGDFGLAGARPARAALGGLAGLAKTAALEWPAAAVKAIDVERGGRPAAEIAAALAWELLYGGPEIEVGLKADGSRLTLESYPEPLAEATGGSLQNAVIVASGGARGVTAATLLALAESAGNLRLALLGRTPLDEEPAACRDVEDDGLQQALLAAAQEAGEQITPLELGARVRRVLAGREIRANLAALAAAGASARYLAVDVRDPEALGSAFAEVRREWGPITGIVHGAGVIADKPLAEKTDEQFDRVFDTKVRGLTALLEATEGDPLTLLCLFSSVTARCGNVGQADYAMANEVLNKLAAAERRRRHAGPRYAGPQETGAGCLVKSLNWGPWEGGMVTPQLKAHFEGLGVPLIPLAAGAQMLVAELTGGAPVEQVEVVLGGDPRPGLSGPDPNLTLELDAVVDERSYPCLESHAIEGVPVVPVVMALEWFARIAAAHCPGLRLAGCRDVEVVRGIRLERFHEAGEVLRVASRVTSGSRSTGCELALEIRDREGALRYRATAEMVAGVPKAPPPGPVAGDLEPWPEAVIYDGEVLFHGPQLQVIRTVDGVSDHGIAGQLVGSREMGWGERWRTDAAALDGGLQLAVLWFKHQQGDASLPMRVASFRSFVQGPFAGPLVAVAESRLAGSDRAVADIVLSNGDGMRVAELRGVEIYRRRLAARSGKVPAGAVS